MAEKAKSNVTKNRMLILGGVVVAAAIVSVAFIVFSTSDAAVRGANFNYDEIPQSTTEDGAQVLGDPDAPITIVEFADFMCPACQEYNSTMERVIENFVMTGQAKLEYRYFLSVDRGGFVSGLVYCATQQGANFWVAHDIMYDLARQGGREVDSSAFAERLDLSQGDLLNCVGDSDGQQINNDMRVGQQAGVTGTPGVRIRLEDGQIRSLGEQFASGGIPYAALESVIQQANAG